MPNLDNYTTYYHVEIEGETSGYAESAEQHKEFTERRLKRAIRRGIKKELTGRAPAVSINSCKTRSAGRELPPRLGDDEASDATVGDEGEGEEGSE